ncbi:MAG: BMP family ABC transporter substrate-binding protein [Marinovum algicola]|uniref:BMP family lipoprotein n=1 Tax=Marinovum algicola TaxID=42444 RepID=UPI0032EC02DD
MKRFILGVAAAALLSGTALAQEFQPAVVYDLGGKFDKSFNEAAYTGAEKFKADTGIEYRDFEIQNDSQREQALRNFARRGANPVVAIGFSHANALEKVAKEFPDTKFAIVDMVVDLPNVRSILFKEHEGSYIVGKLAAMASKTGKVGFVGGMDVPLIRKFACGYAQGAKAVNGDITVLSNMTGTTPAAWNDPVKGSELTKAQISQGADVIYAAAGGTGVGVLQTAADEGILSVGVDSNQNYMHPGKVLTSMLKRVDNAVYDAMTQGEALETGINVMGVGNGGIDYALDEHNEALVGEAMKTAVDEAKGKIASGELTVHDYTSDDSCPDLNF